MRLRRLIARPGGWRWLVGLRRRRCRVAPGWRGRRCRGSAVVGDRRRGCRVARLRRGRRGAVVGAHAEGASVGPSWGGMGGGGAAGMGGGVANSAWRTGTVCAALQAAMPLVHTSVLPVTWPLAMPARI